MICVICNNKINKKIDRWVWLRDYNKEKIDGEVFYHLKCWKEKDKQFDERCRQKVNEGVKKARRILSDLQGKKEVWQIQ